VERDKEMGIFSCDWCKDKVSNKCERTPLMEVFFSKTEDREVYWCYVCRWHWYKLLIQKWFGKRDFGACKVDTDREFMEHMMEEIIDIQYDLMDVREALGIKEEYPELESLNKEEKEWHI